MNINNAKVDYVSHLQVIIRLFETISFVFTIACVFRTRYTNESSDKILVCLRMLNKHTVIYWSENFQLDDIFISYEQTLKKKTRKRN